MKLLGLFAVGVLLCGCGYTTMDIEHLQVAPNTASCDPSGSNQNNEICLVVRAEKDGAFSPWVNINKSTIAGFTYEPGYFYDLTINTSCTRGGIGEFFPLIRKLGAINSKTVDAEEIQPIDPAYFLGSYC